jgi:cyclophilin family peptidyl-prolyl cis-trans isomerase
VRTFVNLANGAQKTIDAKTRSQVQRRFYDGITFHRVVRDQMIQAGDPTGVGNHGCGVHVDDEILPGLRFDVAGRLAVANAGEPNTGGCQFFVTVNPVSPWNGKYTVFGTIVEGMNVVNTINRMPAREDRPIHPVQLISVTVERVGPEPLTKTKRGRGKQ